MNHGVDRREFLAASLAAGVAAATARVGTAREDQAKVPFKISLAQWSLHRAFGRRGMATLDPLNVTIHCNLGMYCLVTGALGEAEAVLSKVPQIGPPGGLAYLWLGTLALAQGRPGQALEFMGKEVIEIFRLVGLAVAHHALGHRDESAAALQQLIRDHAIDSQYQIAIVHAACGDADRAFEWLERAYAARDPGLSWLLKDPFLLRIYDDERWQPLVRKMGLA